MNLLSFKNLAFSIPNKTILQDINYDIHPQDFIILLGSNGSGKSTLIKLLHRECKITRGDILFHDKSINKYSSKNFGKRVSVLTQNCDESLFPSLTVYENYLLLKNKFSYDKQKYPHEKAFLTDYLSDFNVNLAHKLSQIIEQLSGGEKQALALAFCLLNPPELLLLDEHTSALDPKTSETIMQLTQQKAQQYHITCLLTTHDMDIALRYGNRILMLEDGRIYKTFDEDVKKRLTREELIKHY